VGLHYSKKKKGQVALSPLYVLGVFQSLILCIESSNFLPYVLEMCKLDVWGNLPIFDTQWGEIAQFNTYIKEKIETHLIHKRGKVQFVPKRNWILVRNHDEYAL
jgi:hypothetical protein